MSGLQDIYNMMLTIAQTVSKLTTLMPRMGGGVTWTINGISTTAIQILPQNLNRNQVTFHNPNPVGPLVWVYQSTPGSSTVAAPPALGGTYLILPGGFLPIVGGNVTSAWLGFSSSGANVGFTIGEQ